ncbi:lysophospholipid acyltransferase family protein [Candidatus Latescibacterota bacterium]
MSAGKVNGKRMARSKIVKKIRIEIAYLFVRLTVGIFRILPRRVALGVGSVLGRIIPYFAVKDLKLAADHLKIAFGDVKTDAEIMSMARETFRQIAMNFVDTVRIRSMSHDELKKLSVPHNMERLRDALAGGNGVIVLASHTGCWEWSGGYISIMGTPLSAITTKMYDPRLEKMLVETREYAGISVVSRGDNTRDILRTLKNKGAVGVLVDQDTKVKGEFVDFFGQPAHTATAPAILSMRYNSPIIPVLTYRDSQHRHHICIGEPVTIEPSGDSEQDILEITRKCSKVTEDFIREHPTQWVWFHKRWKRVQGTRPEV